MTKATHMRRIAIVALAAASSACAGNSQVAVMTQDALAAPGVAYDAARRAMGPPQLQPVGSPAPLTGGHEHDFPQPEPVVYGEGAPNSLWRPGRRSFFNDQRASRIGDILTVEIEISDKAELSNSSNRQRQADTNMGVSNFFGIEAGLGRVFPGEFDPATMIGAQSDSSQTGQGAINREEKVQLTVAAVIVDRLPNGNLVIAGRQEVRVNAELRELTVSGIIRPEDIDANNTISQDQIAEARISYGGRGQISAVQRPNWGQRAADAISPW